MSEVRADVPTPAPPRSLPARVIGILTSPGETYASVVAHPRWLGMLALSTLLTAGLSFWFVGTEPGQQALLDQQVRQSEAFGQTISDEQYARMEAMLPMMRYITGGSILVSIPVMSLVIAGILFAVFNAGLGGQATFRQVFAVVVHSGAVNIVQQLFTVPVNYFRESMSSATNLTVFMPFLDEGSLAGRFFGMIDLFIVWSLIVLAIGLGVLYKRRATPIVWSLLGVYLVIAAGIAVIIRLVSGGAS